MSTLSHQWANRPADERFTSLTEMASHFHAIRDNSRAAVVSSRRITIEPEADNKGLLVMRAATGPRYGRIWNSDIVDGLVARFGDGLSGDWRVPGEFGKHVEVTKANTTLYGSDRDMFVFLCDEDHRIELPNRRNGEPGTLARGFFVWNSEVGAATFGLATFLFDYVCCNRIVWGATQYSEVTLRHIDDVDKFLAQRFGRKIVDNIKAAHLSDEDRPIETLWDASTAITAYARSIEHQDRRVEVEREAGRVLDLAAA